MEKQVAPAPVAAKVVRGAMAAVPSAVDDVRGIVVRAIFTARASGRDYIAQGRVAAAAVAAVRPDLSPLEVFDTVRRLRDLNAV